MLEKLYDEISNKPALTVVLLVLIVAAYFLGLLTSKYIFDAFSLQVVPKGSFVYNADIVNDYVTAKKYEDLLNQKRDLERTNDELKSELTRIKERGIAYSQAVCNRIAQEIDNYTRQHSQTMSSIQSLTSAYTALGLKDQDSRENDEHQAAELRKYTEQLNQQLTRLREDFSKCISPNK